MKIRQGFVWLTLVLVFGQAFLMVSRDEDILNNGKQIYLELAPVDPRSLIQGDYMNLRYAITNEIGDVNIPPSENGLAVISLDGQGIALFERIHSTGKSLSQGEYLLEYFANGRSVQIGPEAFFFQEGDAHFYEDAEYAELRLSPDGRALLVNMRGENLELLGPP